MARNGLYAEKLHSGVRSIRILKKLCTKHEHCINAMSIDLRLRWASDICKDCSHRFSSNYERGKPRQ